MSDTLTNKHLAILAASAITPEQAEAWGIYTVHDALDLPGRFRGTKSDRYFARGVPGMIFPLRRIDGDVVWQLRCDEPIVNEDNTLSKYVQEPETGSIINISQMMSERVGNASTVLIVEGTKQTVAVSHNIDDENTLVIGIQGCSGWSTGGKLHPDMERACRNVPRVEVLFDADMGSNSNVWDAAKALQEALIGQAGVGEVVICKLRFDRNHPDSDVASAGVRGKDGIDDVLGARDPDVRTTFLNDLRAAASPKLGKRPPEKRKGAASSSASTAPVKAASSLGTATPGSVAHQTQSIVNGSSSEIILNHDEGVTQMVTHNANGEDTTDVIYPFTAEIITEEMIENEINGRFIKIGINYTLKVSAARPGRNVISDEITIASDKLEKVNDWLALVGHATRSVPRFTKPAEQIAFANVVRMWSNQPRRVRRIGRLGWVFDHQDENPQYRWLFPGGGIGARDTSESIFGTPSAAMFASMDVPDPHTLDTDDVRDAVMKFLGVRDLTRESHLVVWDAIVGTFGLSFLPVSPLAALGIFGPRSSGKSTLAMAAAGALSSRWGNGQAAMFTFNATPASMDVVASGVHNCFLHVDDLKPEADTRRRSQVFAMLDDLLRRAHGSGGKGRGGLDSSGEVIVRERDDSAPLLMVTGEEIPTGGGFADSGLDRMFIVTTPHDGLMRRQPDAQGNSDGGDAALRQLETDSKSFPLVTAAYVKWLAEWLNDAADEAGDSAGALKSLSADVDDRTRLAAAIIAKRCEAVGAHMTSRGRTTAARLFVGTSYFLAFCVSSGFITDEESQVRQAQTMDTIVAQAISNATHVMGDNVDGGQMILDRLRAVVAQGRATLTGDTLAGGCVRIGQMGMTRVDGERVDVVNLNPDAVAEVLKWPTGRAGVIRDLGSVSVKGKNGRATRNTSIGGQEVAVVAVLASAWGIESDDTDDIADAGSGGF